MRITVLGQSLEIDCAAEERRRLEDLAAALEARLAGFTGDADGLRSLALAALSLMDEAQAAGAALARARAEIERLSDLLAEAEMQEAAPVKLDEMRGRVGALRAGQGAA